MYISNLRYIIFGLCVFAYSTSYAQTGAGNVHNTEQVHELDDFVVVASTLYKDQVNALKSPTPIIEVPQSLSILTSDQWSQQGIESLTEMIDYIPGVNASQGEGHRDAVVFRGVRSTADFFVDGVRDDVQYFRPLYNVDRVEILRGPNSLFFGRGGTGGVLNRVMKKAEIGQNFNQYELTVNSLGGTSFQFDKNTPLCSSGALRINFFANDLKNHRDFFYGNEYGINPTVKYLLSEHLTLDLSYEYLDTERFVDRGIPTGAEGRPVEALTDIVFGDAAENYSKLEAGILKATLENKFTDTLKGRLNVTFNDFDKLYQNYYVADYNETTEVVTLDGYVDTTQRTNWILSAELIGERELAGFLHKIVTGVEWIQTDNDNDRYDAFFDTTLSDQADFAVTRPIALKNGSGLDASGTPIQNDFSVTLADDTSAEVSVFSFYFQNEIELSENLDWVLGARMDQIDQYVSGTSEGESQLVKWSPRLGLVYKPRESLSLYTSYSQAFEPKSGEQYAKTSSNPLDPNEFENKELGVKWDLKPNLSFTASIFEITKRSPEVDDNDASQYVEIESDISGLEIQLLGRLNSKWYLSAGYGYLEGEQVDQNGPTGLRPRELPKQTFSIWNKYRLWEDCSVGLGLVYQDESYINNSNTASLPAYTRVDAAVYYTLSQHLDLQLNIENLMDRTYFPSAHSTHQVSVGAPINVRFAIKGSF